MTERQAGVRLIIVYKLVKAPVMLALALWLAAAPGAVVRSLDFLARELAEGGATWARAAAWIHLHVTNTVIGEAAVLAGLDGLSTAIEGLLLLSGRVWAEWIVIAGLALLLPAEILSLEHRPGTGKSIVLVVNAAIVIYLARDRVLASRAPNRRR